MTAAAPAPATATATVASARPGRAPYDRISLAMGLRAGLTLAWRNIVQLKYNPQKLIEVMLLPIIFLILFLNVFGGALAGDTGTYLQILLPGLIAQMALFATMGLGATINEDIKSGVFDRLRSLPIARSAPLVGAVLGDTVRFCLTMAVLTGLGTALGFRFHNDPLSVLAAYALAYLFYLSMCWVSLLIGLAAPSPDAVQGFTFAWVMPLTFGSNIFLSDTSSMPGWLQAWVDVNPVTQLADAVRALTLGGEVGNHVWYSVAWAIGIVAVVFPVAVRVFARRL
jgi:oleandomycin transport system permease protein